MKKVLLGTCVLALAGAMTTATFAAERLRGEAGPNDPWSEFTGTIVMDPSFELGTPNAVWTEESTNFGTPLCDELSCGVGGGTGPNSGSWWAWFGGIAAPEEGAVSQEVTIPAGQATLTYWTELPSCSQEAGDFLRVSVDGTEVDALFGNDASCDTIGYVQRSVDISAFAGSTVVLEFRSAISGAGVATMNFFVDDVEITTGGGAGLAFNISGSCPGSMTVEVTGATPGATVGVGLSDSTGTFSLPSGPCTGTEMSLGLPLSAARFLTADGAGTVSFDANAGADNCGSLIQAVDFGTCDVSDVVPVP